MKEWFFNANKFSKHGFILLLPESVYPYEYRDDSGKFNKISLPEKEDFYSHLNMEDIADADYVHDKKDFVKILE